jgi:predicted nucleotidyltransferase
MIAPNMGTMRLQSSRAELFSKTRGALLATLYGHPESSFYLRQLSRMTGAGQGALQRELKHLTELDLIVRTTQGNQVLYRANSQSPIFPEVRSLVAKTVGVHDTIRRALTKLAPKIEAAFVYGSVARQRERADSDVDLMVLGRASLEEIVSALGPAEKALAREINPKVSSADDFRNSLAVGNHFANRIFTGPKLLVIGTQDDLESLAAK